VEGVKWREKWGGIKKNGVKYGRVMRGWDGSK
jgi:hypothetical protein